MMNKKGEKIVIIGCGNAGKLAANILSKTHNVVLINNIPEIKTESKLKYLRDLFAFENCDNCDSPGACTDFGCAIKGGLNDDEL